MVIKILDAIFAILSGLNLNFQLIGQIIAGGLEAFNAVKAALANTAEPTLEQIHQKWNELRPPVNL